MDGLFAVQNSIMLIVSLAVFVAKAFALADAASRKPGYIEMRSPLSKKAWLIILVLAVVAHLLFWGPLSLLNLIGTVAALVYLAQVRGSSL